MGNVEILKRAWATTWKYKILWLFGLFAGAGGGSSSFNYNTGSSSPSSGSGSSAGADAVSRQFLDTAEHYLPLLVVVGVLLVLIGIVFFVLTFAAQGGLVHLANEAEEKREVRGGEGWRVGFKYWGRTFLIDFLVGLPIILVVIVFAVIFGAAIVGIVASAAGLDKGSSAAGAGLVSSIGGLCCGGVLLLVASVAYSIVFGTTAQIALRYAVLEDRTAIESLKAGWADVWAKRGAIGMYFTVWLVSILYGVVLGILLTIFIIPMVFFTVSGNIAGAVGLGFVMALVAALPGAVFGAFVSCAWTLFFRRMTGRDAAVAPASAGPYVAAAPPAPGFPPPPPAPPAPGADPWSAAHSVPEPPAQEPQAPSPPDAAPPEA